MSNISEHCFSALSNGKTQSSYGILIKDFGNDNTPIVTFPSYPLFSNGIAGTHLFLVISMVFATLPEHMFPFDPPMLHT